MEFHVKAGFHFLNFSFYQTVFSLARSPSECTEPIHRFLKNSVGKRDRYFEVNLHLVFCGESNLCLFNYRWEGVIETYIWYLSKFFRYIFSFILFDRSMLNLCVKQINCQESFLPFVVLFPMCRFLIVDLNSEAIVWFIRHYQNSSSSSPRVSNFSIFVNLKFVKRLKITLCFLFDLFTRIKSSAP